MAMAHCAMPMPMGPQPASTAMQPPARGPMTCALWSSAKWYWARRALMMQEYGSVSEAWKYPAPRQGNR